MLEKSKSSLLLFDIVLTSFIPGKIKSEKNVSKLRSIDELRAFYDKYLFCTVTADMINSKVD
jgi:hypothetical protein